MPKVKRYKYKNIAAALAILLLIILGISTSCSSKADSPKKIPDSSSNSSAVKADSSSKKAVKKLTGNYMYVTAKNKTDMVNGDLILVNGDHSFTGTVNNTDTVYSYLFDKNGSQIMSTSSTQLTAKKETFEAFSKMGNDFYADKKISTLMINTAMPAEDDEDSSSACYEHDTGLAFDLHLYDASTGAYPEFTGEGDYSWISENCWKYGLILRYPEDKADITGVNPMAYHFRYVGIPHAEIMTANKLCLEEYIDFVKDYTFEKPLTFTAFDDTEYSVYYVAADKGSTTSVPVPLDDSNNERPNTISGNNVDGYIVCVNMTENAAPADSSSQTDQQAATE